MNGRRTRKLTGMFGLASVAALLLACGSADEGPYGPADGAEETSDGTLQSSDDETAIESRIDFCEAMAERELACDSGSSEGYDVAACVAGEACFNALFRAEARLPLMTCLAERDCRTSDDRCFESVGAKLPTVPGQEDYERSCLDKLDACPSGSFSNDYCSKGDIPWQIFPHTLYPILASCFSEPCDQVHDCLLPLLPWENGGCDDSAVDYY